MSQIVGRTKELQTLESLMASGAPEFLAIYGRRRIGKTFLINQFFKQKGLIFELTGIHDAKKGDQLYNFNREFSDLFFQGNLQKTPANWIEAFDLLRQKINEVESNDRIILFFDELPWLAAKTSGFLEALDHLWNRYLSRDPRILLIGCGSAASWMIHHVINNRGGLHGRLTKIIHLLPFDLAESKQLLNKKQINLPNKQIIDLYLAIGGVAHYLNQIEKGKSAPQNINDLCFGRNGILNSEFHNLYRSLFNRYEVHLKIIRVLAQKKTGLSYKELSHATGLKSGGTISHLLNELHGAGFISISPLWGGRKNQKHYRLIDEYSLFYLEWIEKAPNNNFQSIDPEYWVKKQNTQSYKVWSGFVFENLCLKNVEKIKEALRIGGVETQEGAWNYRPGSDQEQGAQVDLVIDRKDDCINLCEIKYHSTEFEIDKMYADRLRYKKEAFIQQTKTKKAIFLTFITTYGVKKNVYFDELVQNSLTIDQLF